MAKTPTIMLMKLMPAMRCTEPKVSRAAPVKGFCPMSAARSPKAMEITPLRRALPERLITSERPISIRAKYSGGPNARAKPAQSGAKRVSPKRLSVPATKEDMAAMAKA